MKTSLLTTLFVLLTAVVAVAQPTIIDYSFDDSGNDPEFYIQFSETMNTATLTTSNIKVFGSLSGSLPLDITISFYDPNAGGEGGEGGEPASLGKATAGTGPNQTTSAFHYIYIGITRQPLPGETLTLILTTGVQNASNVPLAKSFIRTTTSPFTTAQAGYEAPFAYATEDQPNTVLVADVDGDGIVDLAVLHLNSEYVSIRLGNGDGTFAAAVNHSVGSGLHVKHGAFGDINGDGRIDLVVANSSLTNNLTKFINNGNGGFEAGVAFAFTGSFYPDFVTLADLDGDGDLDLLASSQSIFFDPGNYVAGRILNNGSGSFSSPAVWQVGTQPVSLTAADVDGDNDLDMAVANMNSNSITLLIMNGTGGLTTTRTISLDLNSPRAVAFHDINGDGDLDMFVANHNGNNVLMFENTASILPTAPFAFFPSSFSTGASTFPHKLVFADADADGNSDLIAAGSDLFIFPGNGSGGFDAMETVALDFSPYSMAVADLSGTGSADFALIDLGNDEVNVLLNAVPPNVVSVTPSNTLLNVSATSDIVVVFDRDMNGASLTAATVRVEGSRSGVASGTYGYNAGTQTLTISGLDFMPGEVVTVSVSNNALSTTGAKLNPYVSSYTVAASGNGFFEFASALNTGSAYNGLLHGVDMDGDGDDDLIGFAGNVLNVYENDNGVFSEFSTFALGSEYPEGVHVGDFNNDGKPDLLVWSWNTSGSLLENDGLGNFTRNTTFNFGSSGQKAVTVADFDGDGNLDIAYNIGNAIFNVNYGAGDFTFPDWSFTNLDFNGDYMYPRKLVAGDFNHDGLIDVAGFNDQRDKVFVMLNAGNRTYSPSEVYTVPANTQDIAVANLTGSAYPDLVVASFESNSFTILKSDGDGTFSNIVTYESLPYTLNRVAAFDFSGNGKPDLVFHAEDANENELLFLAYNDGNGGFGNQISFQIPNEAPDWYFGLSSGYAILDADSDGDLDIASRLTNGEDQLIAFILNAAPSGGGSAPTVAASSASANNITHRSARLNWTSGDGLRRLIVMKEGTPVDATLVDDSNYGPNPRFGAGTPLGSGNYLVYGGNGSSTVIQGLSSETTYHYAIYEINGIPGEEKILTAGAPTGSFTTTTAPPVFRISEGSINFSKSNGADWTLEANQDRITDNVWITRANTKGIFNIARENSYDDDNYTSPIGTLWAFGTGDDIENLNFQPWRAAHGGDAPSIVDEPMVMYLVAENAYIEVLFTSWSGGSSSGGGFSYTRGDGDIPGVPAVEFDEVAGYALAFDGVDDYMKLNRPSSISEFPSNITFEMWVKPAILLESGNAVFASGEDDNHQIGIDADGKFFATVYDSGYLTIRGSTVANAGQWYHIAVSAKAGGEVRLYVNGVLEASEEINQVYRYIEHFAYGRADYDEDSYFEGQLDEIRIWTVERTATQIRANMFNTNSGANSVNALGVWQLNEGSGTTLSDPVNGNDITLSLGSANPTWVTSNAPLGGFSAVASSIQSGTVNVGGATLTFNTPFENPVDVFFNEITTEPNVFPTGFTASLGNKYFVIDLVGDPGTFSLDLSLNFGAGVITEANEASPSLLKLFRRSSGSTGEWTEIASASSAIASTGVVTWPNITSFSEFMASEAEPDPILGISEATVTTFFGNAYTFSEGFFDIAEAYGDETFSIKLQDAVVGGTLFVDVNHNGIADVGTDRILNATTSVEYTPSDLEDRLRFRSQGYGVLTASIIFTSGIEADTVDVNFITVETTPTLSGIANQAGWYLMANPLDTPLGTLFSSVWTQGAINSDAPNGGATLFTYNPLTSSYAAVTTDLDTTKVRAGQGVLAYVFAFDTYGQPIPEGGGWPKTLTNEGNPFTSSAASVNVRNVDSGMPEGTSGSEGFNLFGNPYAWPLRTDSLVATLKRADPLANSYVYRWNQPFQTWQLLTSGAIQPYESVFIRAITSGLDADLAFSYDDRHIPTPGKVDADPLFALTLKHATSGLESVSNLRFDENASAGIDPYDGYYLSSYARSFANLFAQVGDQSLVINNLPAGLDRELTVPMHLHASVTGEFELSWDAASIPKGWIISVEDVVTGLVTDLSEGGPIRFSFDRAAKATAGNGTFTLNAADEPVLMLKISGPGVSTGLEDMALLPTEVELGQNYPNPFNPSTQIVYGVPTQSAVNLEVFDILGRRVAVLVNDQMPAGRHTVSFDASRLASGVYVYRLSVGSKVMTRRMVLIK